MPRGGGGRGRGRVGTKTRHLYLFFVLERKDRSGFSHALIKRLGNSGKSPCRGNHLRLQYSVPGVLPGRNGFEEQETTTAFQT